MNRVVTSRAATLMTAALVVVIAACSDSGSQANLTGPNPSVSTGSPGDSGKTGTGTPGSPPAGHPDTNTTSTPAPKPVASFTMLVHVGSVLPGATDTLTTNPIPGATVSIFQQTLVPGNPPGGGADTLNTVQTLVASGVVDASGNFSAPNLKGAAVYVIKVAPPAGSTYQPATTYINEAFADLVKISVTLFGK
jgi:hypothetical protein